MPGLTYAATNPSYFSPSGSPWGLSGSDRFNNAGDIGTFTVTGLSAAAYLVGVLYTPSGNRSTGTVHVLKDGASALATVAVNQQNNSDGTAVSTGAGISDSGSSYASLGVYDISSGTFTCAIHTPDSNYAVANTLYLYELGTVGTRLTIPPAGYAPSGSTTLTYLPGTTDPLSQTVNALELGNQSPAEVLSTANDPDSGNVQLSATFWGSSISATRQQYLGCRADSTPFHTGYYGYVELDNGEVVLASYVSGTRTQLLTNFVAPTFIANHLYTITVNVYTSTKTLIEVFVQDLSNSGEYLTDLGTWSAVPQPCATTLDDVQVTGNAPITGAGRTVFATYNQPINAESYSVASAPPGITPYSSIYPIRYRFDAAGNPLQIRNAGFWWEPSLGLYLMVGVDCSLGSQFITSDDYPNPGGVVLYTSPDFLNWTYVRKITTTTIGGTTFDWTLFPRIRKHPTNGNYYLFIECGFGSLSGTVVSILTSSDPIHGSWTVASNSWVPGGSFLPSGFNFLLDGGTTYLVATQGESAGNSLVNYAALNSGWTDLAAAWSTLTITGITPVLGSVKLEAISWFKHGSDYYIGGSYLSGWSANANQWAKSTTLAGPYAACAYAYTSSSVPNASTSYGTQTNDVFTLPSGTPVLTADLWRKQDFNTCEHLLLPFAFDGSANPTLPWASWVPAIPPGWTPQPSFNRTIFLFDDGGPVTDAAELPSDF